MASVVAGAGVVFEFGLEFDGDFWILEEGAVLAITLSYLKRLSGDMLGYPDGISGATVVGGDEGFAVGEVIDWAGEACTQK
jgi:hypothetical protein